MKDTQFYDEESARYSAKRYPPVAVSYTQGFFKRRLAMTLGFIKKTFSNLSDFRSLLEIGCADGVVVRAIEHAFPGRFMLTGIDIAPRMVEEAMRRAGDARFMLRDSYGPSERVDVIVEIGVINYADAGEDVAFAHKHLKQGGWYILSVAGTESLRNRLKHENGFNNFHPYRYYEQLLQERFTIERVRGCGLFVPYLWRVPVLARPLQALIDSIAGVCISSLCHEKLYLLKKK